jgi:galactokinase
VGSYWVTKCSNDDIREQRETDQSPWAQVVVAMLRVSKILSAVSGNRSFLRLGVVIITINTPSGSGLSTTYALAKVVADAYEGVFFTQPEFGSEMFVSMSSVAMARFIVRTC